MRDNDEKKIVILFRSACALHVHRNVTDYYCNTAEHGLKSISQKSNNYFRAVCRRHEYSIDVWYKHLLLALLRLESWLTVWLSTGQWMVLSVTVESCQFNCRLHEPAALWLHYVDARPWMIFMWPLARSEAQLRTAIRLSVVCPKMSITR